jgi:hypothetical protein
MKDAIKPLAIASVIMLAMALGQMPYGYYVLLKIAICSTFVILALRIKKISGGWWVSAAWAFAALYNPVIRIPFSRDTWSVINLLTMVAIWLAYRKATADDKE